MTIRSVVILAAAAALSISTQVNGADQHGGDREGLLRPRAQISLIDGIRQVASNGEVATVAKFEHEEDAASRRCRGVRKRPFRILPISFVEPTTDSRWCYSRHNPIYAVCRAAALGDWGE